MILLPKHEKILRDIFNNPNFSHDEKLDALINAAIKHNNNNLLAFYGLYLSMFADKGIKAKIYRNNITKTFQDVVNDLREDGWTDDRFNAVRDKYLELKNS